MQREREEEEEEDSEGSLPDFIDDDSASTEVSWNENNCRTLYAQKVNSIY